MFLGKGFKLRKLNKKIQLNFNYSHIQIIINNKIILKKIQKNTILLFSNNIQKLNDFSSLLLNIRVVNAYTKRGLRLSKGIILKRQNKRNLGTI
jgi:ribosomal protein L6P/L9E